MWFHQCGVIKGVVYWYGVIKCHKYNVGLVGGCSDSNMSRMVLGGGATLVFDEGDMMKTVVLSVSADALPELDETIVVSLTAPTNGAVLSPDRSSVTIVILANDEVAGMVGFSPQSRSAVVGEGQRAEFTVERVLSALGRVEVNWTISGNSDPSLEFTAIAGTAVFMEVCCMYVCAYFILRYVGWYMCLCI